ncbi:Domain of uncharacterised function (DUF1735) [Sphingobacterium spiritivorum]|uniref:Domain of uncharacterized function (DUF1735) n=1 Tax=Sphingobacterium spiritivorum TaxID=258 RepID=A0A380CQR8_SPHSI|nr:DUF1735 and LamG domain-containing protein [Sphingobacterium spiritivorum]SUJ26750.1 Domain of uncharacterised function (DUF1735) [Sphingobacterium spiritivorum]
MSRIYYYSFLFFVAFSFYSCKKSNVESSGIYITDPDRKGLSERLLPVDDKGGSLVLSASASKPVNSVVNLVFETDSNLIQDYNIKNGTKYKALPKRFYSLSSSGTGNTGSNSTSVNSTISTGSSLSSSVTLKVFPFDNTITEGDQYMIPVKIASVSGEIPLLESSKVTYVVIGRVFVNSALYFPGGTFINFNIHDPLVKIKTWTAEFRIKMPKFGNNAVMGAYPDEIYVRFGDVISDPNQLQVKFAGLQPFSNTHFAANTWYHVAIVFDGNKNRFTMYVDGVQDFSIPVPAGTTFSLNTMWFASGNSGLPATAQEVRFWTKALSQTEIRSGMCSVNPKSEGLYGYWKF